MISSHLQGPSRQLAPQKILLYLFGCAVLFVALCVYLALQPQWLGMSLTPDARATALRIDGLAPSHPNAVKLSSGDKITGLINGHGEAQELPPRVILEDPDVLPSYTELEAFFHQQSTLTLTLQTPPLQLTLADGQTVSVKAIDRFPSTLPLYFWWQVLIGFACFAIGAGVWAFRRDQAAAQLLFISSIGALGFTGLSAVYSSRELALDGDLFRLLLITTHFSTILHTSALLALVWVYPRPLGKSPMPALIFMAGGVAWLLDSFQLVTSALWSHYLFCSAAFVVGLTFVYGQWRATRKLPVERAILRWFIMAIFFACLANILILKAPLFFGERPTVGQGWVFVAQLLMYAGLALGVLRYRLFDLERWWFRAWLWFFAGFVIVAVDIALIATLNMEHSDALLISLLLAAWLYFPARQWIWSRLIPNSNKDLSELLVSYTANLIDAGTETRIGQKWPQLLKNIFNPLEISEKPKPCSTITIGSNGLQLNVPSLDDNLSLVLHYPAAGARLFNHQDIERATVLLDIARHAAEAAKAREEGARTERERIMRDLHDDLGARLLSLIYTTENENSQYLARAAIDDLHGILASAKGSPITLPNAIETWCSEGRRRLKEADIQGQFLIADELSALHSQTFLHSRTHANTGRILREAMSNSIRHGKPQNVKMEFALSFGALTVTITDDGKAQDPSRWKNGHGLHTIQSRAKEIGATLQWQRPSGGGCQFSMRLRLEPSLTKEPK